MVVVDASRPLPNASPAPPGTESERSAIPPALMFGGVSPHRSETPLEHGQPVYRAVFTTLKAAFADGELATEGALLRWGNGAVVYGYMNAPDAFPGRRAGTQVMPEHGRLVAQQQGGWSYESRGPVRRRDGGSGADLSQPGPVTHQFNGDRLEDVFFIELVVEIDALTPLAEALATGRRRAAPYKTLIELFFGPRILAARITEEVGRLADDGRYEQSLESEQVVMEWAAGTPLYIEPRTFYEWASNSVARLAALPASKRRRVDLACDWYWLALESVDRVTSYLQFWFVLEVVAMPNETNLDPACRSLAGRLGRDIETWRGVLEPLRNLRGSIAHQGKREVSLSEHELLGALAEVFLGFELGLTPERATAMVLRATGSNAAS